MKSFLLSHEEFIASYESFKTIFTDGNPFYSRVYVEEAVKTLANQINIKWLIVSESKSFDRVFFIVPVVLKHIGPVSWVDCLTHVFCFLTTPVYRNPSGGKNGFETALSCLFKERPYLFFRCKYGYIDFGNYPSRYTAVLNRFQRSVVDARNETTFHRLSSKRKKQLLKKGLKVTPPLTATHFTTPPFPDEAEQYMTLESQGWKGSKDSAMKNSKEQETFFRNVSSRDDAPLIFHFLYSGERPVAISCSLVSGHYVMRLKTTYDPEFHNTSPGSLLELHILEYFHVHKKTLCIDSCTAPGSEFAKRIYPDTTDIGTLFFFKPGASGSLGRSLVLCWDSLTKIPGKIKRCILKGSQKK